MKKKFRKLIALICALCMLLSNISFAENMEAELPAESGEQTTEVQSETPEEQQAEANPEGGEAEQGEPSQDGSEEQLGEEENQPAESDVQHEDAQQEPEVKPQAPVEEPEKPVVQPETPQEAAHEQQQEGQEPGDQEPADQTDPDVEIPEIKAGTSVNGKVAPDDVYRIRLIPEEDQELVFMLILPSWGEGAISRSQSIPR